MSVDRSTATPVPDWKDRLRAQWEIARPDHWFKNVFMLPGTALAVALGGGFGWSGLGTLVIGIAATCLIASANYTINEWLDAEFDRNHPLKQYRASVQGRVTAAGVYLQWTVLAVIGLGLASAINGWFLLFAAFLLFMGIVYNVPPMRTKDSRYLDVLTESINNPLRFLLGWTVVVDVSLPPSSILLAYWMGGAYLMAVKRYAEYRFIGNPESAGAYRRSFKFYTEQSLLVSAFFYALTSAFFLGVFLIKYRIEFLLAIPFLAVLFAWYLKIGMESESVAQRPEQLYRKKSFMLFIAVMSLVIAGLFFIDLPWLNILVDFHVLPAR